MWNKLCTLIAILSSTRLGSYGSIIAPSEFSTGDYSIRFFINIDDSNEIGEIERPVFHSNIPVILDEPALKYGPPSFNEASIKFNNKYEHRTFVIVPFEPDESEETGTSLPSKPATVYGVPSKPAITYGVPVKPPSKYEITYDDKYVVQDKTFIVIPIEPEESSESEEVLYIPPSKPATTYGVPVQPAVTYSVPKELNFKYTVPHTDVILKVEEEFIIPEVPLTSYGFPVKQIPVPKPVFVPVIKPFTSYELPKKPHSIYGVPL